MTWTPITQAEMDMARHVITWIATARAQYGANWLPSGADCSKSALLERLRAGKEPLPEPPPLGMSCPWYAVVEDPGPHYVFDVWRGDAGNKLAGRDTMCVLQSLYKIETETSDSDFIVRDARHNTSYRFRLWHDPEWTHPSGRIKGGWFMQNVAAPLTQQDRREVQS